MPALPWEKTPTGSLIAQLEDRRYFVQFQQSFNHSRPHTWKAGCTMTPGPHLFAEWGFPTEQDAVAFCETHYMSREVSA